MKLKFLLFFLLLSGGMLSAQDTIRTLIITEARYDRTDGAYVEITNVGDEPIQMADFEFGRLSAWNTQWTPDDGSFFYATRKSSSAGRELSYRSRL